MEITCLAKQKGKEIEDGVDGMKSKPWKAREMGDVR
jgi:hypothetical protein